AEPRFASGGCMYWGCGAGTYWGGGAGNILRGRSRHVLGCRRSECRLREPTEAKAAARREQPAHADAEILRGEVVQREEGARTGRRVLTMDDGGLRRTEI